MINSEAEINWSVLCLHKIFYILRGYTIIVIVLLCRYILYNNTVQYHIYGIWNNVFNLLCLWVYLFILRKRENISADDSLLIHVDPSTKHTAMKIVDFIFGIYFCLPQPVICRQIYWDYDGIKTLIAMTHTLFIIAFYIFRIIMRINFEQLSFDLYFTFIFLQH